MHGSQNYTSLGVCGCLLVSLCVWKKKRGELKLECTVVECVFTYSSSSHALPQTGNTPLPRLCVYVACPLASVRICVSVHLNPPPVCVCVSASPWYFTADSCVHWLACRSVWVCVCVCVCLVCSLLNEGQLVPHSGFHTHWLSFHCLSVCLFVSLPQDRRTDNTPLSHRQEWS